MRNDTPFGRALASVSHYFIYFLLIAFAITCSMMLFVSTLMETLDITLTAENVSSAAKLTFANILVLSLTFTAVDEARRRLTFDRTVRRITQAVQQMMRGDFSVRITPTRGFQEEHFGEIIDCINRMAQELSGIETLRTDFVANVSHEIKTPLSIIANYGTMLQEPGLPQERRVEYARIITGASRRLSDLVTNILRLNKLENQQIFLKNQRYDLGEQLCECLLGFEDAWEKKQIEIETEIKPGVLVCGDPEMMTLVWNNLFSNAFKFTGQGGKVGLSLSAEGEEAVVRVRDTGCGISREVGSRMFDKFYQGDTSHAAQGNGLGLALVRRVVEITGSEISVESEVGKGTTFTVRMRREADAAL